MQKLLIPSNVKIFDVASHFEENNRIDWIIKKHKWEIGDIVYIYVSNPTKKIICKTIIEKEVIYDGTDEKGACLRLIKKIDCEALSYKNLLKHGLKGPIFGPRNPNEELEEYIEKCFDNDCEFDKPKPFSSDKNRNIIYFGAPGTGKSYNLNKDKDILLENYENNYERVTFHPDFSYANFVGTYKPVPENNSITYKYVPGPFMTVLKKALENPNEPYLLIIEEINRANVAAVFGDVFQLLDRAKNNESVYPIDATEDMKVYINQDKIKIPQNMFIWATMNSADQGVFPMDTAFKRRWDFKYFGIDEGEDNIKNSRVVLNNKEIYWNDIRKEINEELLSYKINEDKLLGPFFAYNEYLNQEIPEDTFKEIFKNKIIMYLFEDAARSKRNDLFQGAKGSNKYVTYSEICEMFDEKGLEIFCDNIKSKFIRNNEKD